MSRVARDALAAHTEALRALHERTRDLESAARLEAQKERELFERAAWEEERTLGPPAWGKEITAVATWPTGDVLAKWLIGVGCNGKLLAVYEVTNYKGGRLASLKHYVDGAPPPIDVELEVFRRWNLKRPGRG